MSYRRCRRHFQPSLQGVRNALPRGEDTVYPEETKLDDEGEKEDEVGENYSVDQGFSSEEEGIHVFTPQWYEALREILIPQHCDVPARFLHLSPVVFQVEAVPHSAVLRRVCN